MTTRKTYRWLVITDLDGTLLDARTYSCKPAGKALHYLKRKGIPVVPCTSKTHHEVLAFRRQIGLDDPFIVENGSAIFLPESWARAANGKVDKMDGSSVLILGKPYTEIRAFLAKLREQFQLRLAGFADLTTADVQKYTDLPEAEAALARKRYFSEPFVLIPESRMPDAAVNQFVRENGFRLLRGNRFYHLLGASDKGMAVRRLMEIAEHFYNMPVRSLGIGDSMNDLEMLQAVDVPATVKKADGSYEEGLEVANLYRAEGIGPAGWDEIIRRFVT